MDARNRFRIRVAHPSDLPEIIALEAATFGNDGIAPYGAEHFEAWLNTNNPGFIVAEHEGRIGGYLYMQSICFDPWRRPENLTYDFLTDNGYTTNTHNPAGDCCHAISLGSIIRGAGRSLMEEGSRLASQRGQKFYFCFSRLSGFSEWLAQHPLLAAQADCDPIAEEQMAFWYAKENGRITNGLVWPEAAERFVPALPPVHTLDPVLGCHLKVSGFGLLGIIPKCMHDPKSRDFAGLMAKKLTT